MKRAAARLALVAIATVVVLAAFGSSAGRAAQNPDVSEALLTLDDLPAGWSGGAVDVDAAGFATSICDIPFERDTLPGSQAAALFRGSQIGPLVLQGVGLGDFESAVEATSVVREIALPCDWTLTASGMTVNLRLTPGELPSFGDESVSWRVRGRLGLATLDGDLVWIRRGGTITTLLHIAVGLGSAQADPALTEALAQRADERLSLVAGP